MKRCIYFNIQVALTTCSPVQCVTCKVNNMFTLTLSNSSTCLDTNLRGIKRTCITSVDRVLHCRLILQSVDQQTMLVVLCVHVGAYEPLGKKQCQTSISILCQSHFKACLIWILTYSRTSYNGPFEKRTTSLQRTKAVTD